MEPAGLEALLPSRVPPPRALLTPTRVQTGLARLGLVRFNWTDDTLAPPSKEAGSTRPLGCRVRTCLLHVNILLLWHCIGRLGAPQRRPQEPVSTELILRHGLLQPRPAPLRVRPGPMIGLGCHAPWAILHVPMAIQVRST